MFIAIIRVFLGTTLQTVLRYINIIRELRWWCYKIRDSFLQNDSHKKASYAWLSFFSFLLRFTRPGNPNKFMFHIFIVGKSLLIYLYNKSRNPEIRMWFVLLCSIILFVLYQVVYSFVYISRFAVNSRLWKKLLCHAFMHNHVGLKY